MLFTNFSKHKAKQNIKKKLSGINGGGEKITFTQLIKSYREKLIFQILEDQQSNNVGKVTELVEDFLPNENFYTFKLDENHDESREEMEEQEIVRIVEDNLTNGAQVISNDGVLAPVIQEAN